MKWMSQSKLRFAAVVVIGLVTSVAFQNCAKQSSGPSEAPVDTQLMLEQQAMSVLTTRCMSCHNSESKAGGVDVTNINELLAIGLVIPAEPSLSLIYTTASSYHQSQNLSQNEVKAIHAWITDGFKNDTPVTPLPTGETKPTWVSIKANIIDTNCLGCHGTNQQSGGVSFATYNLAMNTVQRGVPNQSALYTSVAVRMTMPRGRAALSTADRNIIAQWISLGAPEN